MLVDHTPARSTPPSASDHPWNTAVCLALIQRLWALRKSMLAAEHRYALAIERAGAHQRDSARNLVHFLAMRATDLRGLQSQLAWLGVSSLGRSESHVLANVDKVLGIARALKIERIYCPYIMPDDRPTTSAGWRASSAARAAPRSSRRTMNGWPAVWTEWSVSTMACCNSASAV